MPQSEEEFLKKLLDIFKVEAKEHIENSMKYLVELENSTKADEYDKITEIIFRETHSLKGASRSVDFLDIESICQNLESIFRFLKDNYHQPDKIFFDRIHSIFNMLEKLVGEEEIPSEEIEAANDELLSIYEKLTTQDEESSPKIENEKMVEKVEESKEDIKEPKPNKVENVENDNTEPKTKIDSTDSEKSSKKSNLDINKTSSKRNEQFLRISADRLNALMLKVEDLLSVKLSENNTVEKLQSLRDTIFNSKKEFSKLLKTENLNVTLSKDESDNNEKPVLADWVTKFIKELEKEITSISAEFKNIYRMNSEKIDETSDELRKVLMMPFSMILDLFPKMVRDIAHDEEKEINCEIIGKDVEIDKRILDELKDPLIHLIRNSVDHGIELPEEREKSQKPRAGSLKISVTNEAGRNVKVLIEDDGKGIDPEAVYQKAISKNLIDEKKEITESEKLNLIFESGISTSQVITDLSGRGLGLAIVKEKVNLLGGSLKIETKKSVGTKFTILLPASIATFRGIITKSKKRFYVFPTIGVARVINIPRNKIRTAENKSVISYNNITVPVFHLQDIIEIREENRVANEHNSYSVLIIGSENPIGIIVDEVVREQELMLKNLGNQLKNITNVMGATILGDGRIATVLYIPHLIKNASGLSGASIIKKENAIEKEKVKVLIAEDSITSRMLLVNILEIAGYEVTSTVDGSEAYTTIKSDNYDIVVSDVDMPNMNGFELTEKIRKDEKLKDTPIILVTALKSRADKERGMDVGANAYIVKSSFKPETLLSTIKKFV